MHGIAYRVKEKKKKTRSQGVKEQVEKIKRKRSGCIAIERRERVKSKWNNK